MHRYFLALMISCFFFTYPVLGGDKVKKSIIKIEQLMAQGNIKKAEKSNEKLLVTLKKSSNQSHQYQYGLAIIRKGCINAFQYGQKSKFEHFLKQGSKHIETKFKKESPEFISAQIMVGEAYFGAGFYHDAVLKLQEIEAAKSVKLTQESNEAFTFFKLKLYRVIGDYNKALKFSEEVLINLKNENSQNSAYHSAVLNYEGALLLDKGEYKKAYEILNAALDEINSSVGKHSLLYADNSYIFADYYMQQNEPDVALSLLEDAYAVSKNEKYPMFYSQFSTTRESVYADFSMLLEVMNQGKYALDVMKEYLKTTKKYTGKGTFYSQRKHYYLLKNSMFGADYESVISEVARIRLEEKELCGTAFFDAQLQELVLDCNYALSNFNEAEKSLNSLAKIYLTTYGENTLHSYGIKLDLARLYAIELHDFKRAIVTFKSDAYIKMSDQLTLSHEDMIYYNEVLAEVYVGLEEVYKAKDVLTPQLEYLESYYYEDDKNGMLPKLYVKYAEVLVATGDYKEAGQYLEKAQLMYDEIYHDVADYEDMLKIIA